MSTNIGPRSAGTFQIFFANYVSGHCSSVSRVTITGTGGQRFDPHIFHDISIKWGSEPESVQQQQQQQQQELK